MKLRETIHCPNRGRRVAPITLIMVVGRKEYFFPKRNRQLGYVQPYVVSLDVVLGSLRQLGSATRPRASENHGVAVRQPDEVPSAPSAVDTVSNAARPFQFTASLRLKLDITAYPTSIADFET